MKAVDCILTGGCEQEWTLSKILTAKHRGTQTQILRNFKDFYHQLLHVRIVPTFWGGEGDERDYLPRPPPEAISRNLSSLGMVGKFGTRRDVFPFAIPETFDKKS